MPPAAGKVSGPFRVAPVGLVDSASVTMPVKLVARFLYWSSASTARPKPWPATMVPGGGTESTSWVAVAGATSIEPVVADDRPGLVATIV